ncbi:hypothetical protein [Hyphomonas johnsonii]|uniref:Lipoprotein n=1 Tax=Hyphomonas johnsonii MHS-2 TaxID=1280950 RepID=A0A059FPZ9_9PROT|nr:hypothetical protein [Hyphomonas johnsonii]KCZ92697.1 hypothetical protein HJO_07077 [Hyphomonas johnsonii MHS-2]
MKRFRYLLVAPLLLATPACVATKIVTVPVGIAVGATKMAGKSVIYVGGTAVRVTGDALDGPDEKVKLDVTLKTRTGRTKHVRKTVKVKYLEREIKKIEKKGRIVDVEVKKVD